jgi:chemotaxis protein CheD
MDYAIREIAHQFDELGVQRKEIHIKLFGGAEVLLGTGSSPARATVGSLNLESALKVLADEGLKVVASSVGGNAGLKIYFNTGTGEVHLRRLSTTNLKARR